MRTLWRVVLPLMLGLALLAWGATVAVNATTRAWFTRDVALRARLAASSVQESLAAHMGAAERWRIVRVLEGLAQDERIMAAEVCSPAWGTVARTEVFPEAFDCQALRVAH